MNNESDFDVFIELLEKATLRIESEYFLLPVAGSEDAIYRERVYCYELYHRLREVLTEDEFPYSLAGEVDKKGHTIICPKIGARQPDFIVHVPGIMDRNLVIIEVKPIIARVAEVKKDLEKLALFLKEAETGYDRAIHLVYGGNEENVKKYVKRSFGREKIEFSNSLFLFWHKEPHKKVEIYDWVSLIRNN